MQHEKLMKSLIIKDFRSFYEEVVLLKAMALSGALLAEAREGEDAAPSTLCKKIHDKLMGILTTQYQYIERHGGGFAARYYREAQYIMVALADEVFLDLEWIGKEEWKDHLLEASLFKTQVAGEKFFSNLDEFLAVRDPANSDIGVLYIFALGLGFKGKYKGIDDRGELKEYREQLQARVMHGSPYAMEEFTTIFPEAYKSTIDSREGAKVPTARRWAMILGYVILAYLVLAWIIWATSIGEIENLVDQIMYWVQTR